MPRLPVLVPGPGARHSAAWWSSQVQMNQFDAGVLLRSRFCSALRGGNKMGRTLLRAAEAPPPRPSKPRHVTEASPLSRRRVTTARCPYLQDMVPKARMAWQLHGPPGIVPSPGSDSAAQGAANHHTTDATPRHRHERGTTRRDEAWTGRQAGRHPERMDGWMDGRPPRWLAQTGWHERQSKLRSESGADDSHSAGPFRTRRVHSAKGARAE